MRYRVDDVPWFWRPVWLAWSWVIALVWGALLLFLNATCRLRIDGAGPLTNGANYIYSFWHQSLPLWFVGFLRRQHGYAWLQHPAAYMKPVHIVLGLMGAQICLGSSGEEGRSAAAKLTDLVRAGASTVITPDGPKGPPGILKKGVLHIAAGSGVPVVPVRLSATRFIRLPTWDRKVVPLPFSTIIATLGTPVSVDADNFEESAHTIAEAMTGGSASHNITPTAGGNARTTRSQRR